MQLLILTHQCLLAIEAHSIMPVLKSTQACFSRPIVSGLTLPPPPLSRLFIELWLPSWAVLPP